MNQSPRPRLVQVTHESGEFLVRFNLPGTEADALAHAAEQASERWDLDVTDVHIATQEDINLATGQVTDLDTDI